MSLTTRSATIFTLTILPFSFINPNVGFAQELPSFALIAGQSLSNTGSTTIDGNIAVSPGISFTGSGSVTQTGTTFIGDAVGVRLQNDLTTLYTFLAGLPTSTGGNLTGQDLGGMTLLPGVYNFDSSALLSAGQTLTLDAGGDPDAVFIINIGSTLTVGSGASVILENGAQGGNLFYRIGSSATLDTSADFFGQIVALTSITMNTAATIDCGAAYARNGSITLDTNTIGICVLDSVGFDDVIDVDDPDEDPDELDGDDSDDDDEPNVDEPDNSNSDGDSLGNDTSAILPQNALNVALALADYETEGGVLPLSFAILAGTQSPEQLAVSLDQLSGEISTGVSQIGLQSMSTFIDLVTHSTRTSTQRQNPPQDEGVPVGLVPDRSNDYLTKYDATPTVPSLNSVTTDLSETTNWNIWAAGYGSHSIADGSATAGTSESTIDTSGLAIGLELSPNIYSTFGVALAFDQGSIALEDGFSSAESEGVYLAVYGVKDFENGYVKAALAYSRNDVTTDRTVTIAGSDRFIADVTTSNVAGQIEAGYNMGSITPFAVLRAQRVTAPAYSESTVSGASTYALDYDEQTTQSVSSELGAALSLVENDAASLGLRASWAHEFMPSSETDATFQAIPGSVFSVEGAAQESDVVIIALTGEYGAALGVYADANLVTKYGGASQSYGGSFSIGYRW